MVIILAGMYLYLSPKLPSVESVRDIRLQIPLRVYSADGEIIAEFGEKRRTPVRFADIPEDFINALLAAEDANFFQHGGVSIKGLARAAMEIILTGERGSGGSTITMQLTRNIFLSLEQTFTRKFNEILLATKLEKELSKEEILELYVNLIFLGKRAYGIEAAANIYYDKSIGELSLAQMAMIAGLPQGPSTQNPIANPERAKTRRNWILGRMLQLGYIGTNEYERAVNEDITARDHGGATDEQARYVAEMARTEALSILGPSAYTEGYRVYTTVDSKLQKRAQEAVIEGLITYDQRHGYRGPERRLLADSNQFDETAVDETATHDERAAGSVAGKVLIDNLEEWQKELAKLSDYGGMHPAIVVDVGEKNIKVVDKKREIIDILWEHGIEQAKPYINENSTGPAPQKASDVVQMGDIVRIRKSPSGSTWWLSQIPEAQAALVSLDPSNGAIRALVGGFDFKQSKFNRITQAKRQPGSNFKPFIYTAALEHGMSAATIINDAPIVFEDDLLENTWRPENDSGKFYGPTRLRKALYLSRNLVSIRIMRQIGIGDTLKSLEKFGFNPGELPRDLSLALGSHATTPLKIAAGYMVFANRGYQTTPFLVKRIEDTNGKTVYEAKPYIACAGPSCGNNDAPPDTESIESDENNDDQEPFVVSPAAFELSFDAKSQLSMLRAEDYPLAPKVLDDRVAYIIDSLLRDVVQRGTGTKAKRLERDDLAGKTGTTNGPNDAWFSGYNGHLVTTTWLGFDQNRPLGRGEYGGSAALPIWIDFMSLALSGKESTRWPQPNGVVSVRIDPETGERARPDDPDGIFEIFRVENVPKENAERDRNIYRTEEGFSEDLF